MRELLRSLQGIFHRAVGKTLSWSAKSRKYRKRDLVRREAERATAKRNWLEARKCWQALLDVEGVAAAPEVYARLAQALRGEGYVTEAAATVHQGLLQFPTDLKLKRELAELATARRDWSEAIKCWAEVVNLSGKRARPQFYVRVGEACLRLGDTKGADAIIRQGLSHHPDNPPLKREFAGLATVSENWPEAVNRWRTVLALTEKDALASDYIQLSNALRHQGDLDAADVAAQQANAAIASCYDSLVGTYQEQNELFQTRDYWLTQLITLTSPGGCVLDLGCGAGIPVARKLVMEGFKVLGVDISKRQIEAARSNVADAAFRQADISRIEFEEASFDSIAAFYSIIHVPRAEHEALLARIASWLKPGGIFAATLGVGNYPDRSKRWIGGKHMFFSHFDAETNQRLVRKAGLVIERSQITKEEDNRGRVLWLLARKPASYEASD